MRHVQAVAYPSGIAASSSQGKSVLSGTTHACVLGIATINRSTHAAHDGGYFFSRSKPAVNISFHDANTLDAAHGDDIAPLAFPHVCLGMVQSEGFDFDYQLP